MNPKIQTRKVRKRREATMTLKTARIVIFNIWISFFAVYSVFFMIAPLVRPSFFSYQACFNGLFKMLSLIIPVLSAFGAFWFHGGEREAAPRPTRRRRADPQGDLAEAQGAMVVLMPLENWWPALVSTILYHMILVFYIFSILFIYNYEGNDNPDVRSGLALSDLVTYGMQYGMLCLPLATAPAAYYLGIDKIQPRTHPRTGE